MQASITDMPGNSNGCRDLDLYGLSRLLRALTATCGCELGKWHEDCHAAPLDRWWVATITGCELDGAR